MLAAKTGCSVEEIADGLEALIVTRGAQGSQIHAGRKVLAIPPAPAAAVVDPTGCGDAYRAGLLYGIAHGLGWETAGRLASVMGAIKIEQHGAQRHRPERAQIAQRFFSAFGYRPWD